MASAERRYSLGKVWVWREYGWIFAARQPCARLCGRGSRGYQNPTPPLRSHLCPPYSLCNAKKGVKCESTGDSQRGLVSCPIISSTNSTTPRSAPSGPPRTRPGSISRTRSIRSPTPPSAAAWRRGGTVRAHDPALRQARIRHRSDARSTACASPVHERIVWERPFCRLLHFEKTARLERALRSRSS